MAIQMRPGYINPLTTMTNQKSAWKWGQPATKQEKKPDKVKELQTRQQQLQNQMLMLKSTGSDSAGVTAETTKALEEELEEVTTELRAAKGDISRTIEQTEDSQLDAGSAPARPRMDVYEPEKRGFWH